MAGKKRRRAKREGSIWQRPDGRYGVSAYQETPEGYKRRSTTRNTEDEALAWQRQMESDGRAGLATFDPERLTMGEYLDRWLAVAVEGQVARLSYNRIESHLRIHIKPALGSMRLSKLTAAHIASFYAMKRMEGTGDGMVQQLHTTLGRALR